MHTTMAICMPLDRQSVKSYLMVCLRPQTAITPRSSLSFLRVRMVFPLSSDCRSVLAQPMREWLESPKKRKMSGWLQLLLQSRFSLILRGLNRLFLPTRAQLSQSRYSSPPFTLYSFHWQPLSPKQKKQDPTSTLRPATPNQTYLQLPRSTFSPLKFMLPTFCPFDSISFVTPSLRALKISPTVPAASPNSWLQEYTSTMIFWRTSNMQSRVSDSGKSKPCWQLAAGLVCISFLRGRLVSCRYTQRQVEEASSFVMEKQISTFYDSCSDSSESFLASQSIS